MFRLLIINFCILNIFATQLMCFRQYEEILKEVDAYCKSLSENLDRFAFYNGFTNSDDSTKYDILSYLVKKENNIFLILNYQAFKKYIINYKPQSVYCFETLKDINKLITEVEKNIATLKENHDLLGKKTQFTKNEKSNIIKNTYKAFLYDEINTVNLIKNKKYKNNEQNNSLNISKINNELNYMSKPTSNTLLDVKKICKLTFTEIFDLHCKNIYYLQLIILTSYFLNLCETSKNFRWQKSDDKILEILFLAAKVLIVDEIKIENNDYFSDKLLGLHHLKKYMNQEKNDYENCVLLDLNKINEEIKIYNLYGLKNNSAFTRIVEFFSTKNTLFYENHVSLTNDISEQNELFNELFKISYFKWALNTIKNVNGRKNIISEHKKSYKRFKKLIKNHLINKLNIIEIFLMENENFLNRNILFSSSNNDEYKEKINININENTYDDIATDKTVVNNKVKSENDVQDLITNENTVTDIDTGENTVMDIITDVSALKNKNSSKNDAKYKVADEKGSNNIKKCECTANNVINNENQDYNMISNENAVIDIITKEIVCIIELINELCNKHEKTLLFMRSSKQEILRDNILRYNNKNLLYNQFERNFNNLTTLFLLYKSFLQPEKENDIFKQSGDDTFLSKVKKNKKGLEYLWILTSKLNVLTINMDQFYKNYKLFVFTLGFFNEFKILYEKTQLALDEMTNIINLDISAIPETNKSLVICEKEEENCKILFNEMDNVLDQLSSHVINIS